MRVYETGTIFFPDLPDDQNNDMILRIEGEIEKHGGKIVEVNQWGLKKLTYSIKKQQRGYYTFFKYVAPAKVIAELEHLLRVMEHVVRFMTVKLDEEMTEDALAAVSKVHKKPTPEPVEEEEHYAREDEFEGNGETEERTRSEGAAPAPVAAAAPAPVAAAVVDEKKGEE